MNFKPKSIPFILIMAGTIQLIACQKNDMGSTHGNAIHSVQVTTIAKGVNYAVGGPVAIAIDPQGNIYEPYSNLYDIGYPGHLQKITQTGIVTGHEGLFGFEIAIDNNGNMYGSTGYNILKVVLDSGSTVLAGDTSIQGYADGTGFSARFYGIGCMTTDSHGNIYVGEYSNFRIRKITSSGVVTTLAGNGKWGSVDGNGSTAEFKNPEAIGTDSLDNVYVSDPGSQEILKITPAGFVSIMAIGVSLFNMAVDPGGNIYYIKGNIIYRIDPSGRISFLAGNSETGYTDGNGDIARFNMPGLLISDKNGNIFIVDYGNNAIRKITIN